MVTEKDLVFSGYAGEAGGRLIAAAKQEFLRSRFREDYVERLIGVEERSVPESVPEAAEEGTADIGDPASGKARKRKAVEVIERELDAEAPDQVEKVAFAAGAAESIRVKQGGALAAFYALARTKKCGLRIHLKQIPILQGTVELCELFSLNPYRLYSDCYIFAADNGFRLAEQLNAAGIPSACVGCLTGGLDKLIVDKQETEYLNRPEPDELLKLFPDAVL